MDKIFFLRGFYPNPRCERRLDALVEDFNLYLLYWEKGKTKDIEFKRPKVSTKRIYIRANPTKPIKRLYQYIKLYQRIFDMLRKNSFQIIYPEALDMLVIAYLYKVFNKNVKIIYEVADIHSLIIDKQNSVGGVILQKILKLIEKICCKKIDLLVLTSEKYYDAYYRNLVCLKKMIYIPNSPNPQFFKTYTPKSHDTNHTIGFIGSIRYKQEIEMLFKAAENSGWNVLLAGNDLTGCMKQEAEKRKNVRFHGRYDYDTEIARLYGECDVVYSVYNASGNNEKIALPNKLYEAIYCELPIIVSKGTYAGDVVNEWGVGLCINHCDNDELSNALCILEDKKEYERIRNNCEKIRNEIINMYYSPELKERIHMMV